MPKQRRTAPESTTKNTSSGKQLEELRRLLGVADADQVAGILNRLDDPDERARDLSGVLPDAVTLSARSGDRLGNALESPVQQAVHTAIRHDPQPFASALYPAMAPAIRKAIAETLRGMVQSLNEILENSLSFRGLRWRWQALRTGRPFAEVALSHCLVFRAEQAFLIHRETGLLLQHAVDPAVEAQDPDLVSGMLTAIQDFVHDSFEVGDEAGLENFRVSDLTVWIERGRDAVLAVAVRGNAPESLRETMRDHLRAVHLAFPDDLAGFDGDAGVFGPTREMLEACLVSRYRKPSSRPSFLLWLIIALLVVLLGTWTTMRLSEHRRWTTFIEELEAAPGIVVTAHDSDGGRHEIRGLRDPLAADPAAIATRCEVGGRDIHYRWEAFTSLDEELVLKRATSALDPPEGTTIKLDDGVLTTAGTAPARWIEQSSQRVLQIPGVDSYHHVGERSGPGSSLLEIADRARSRLMRFPSLGDELPAADVDILDTLADDLTQLFEAADAESWWVEVVIEGHADNTGNEGLNIDLSTRRAESVMNGLVARGVPADRLTVRGMGSSQPLRQADGTTAREYNRRVSVDVEFAAAESDDPR